MASPVDKGKIKKINSKVDKFKVSIDKGNIDANLLKGIIGKKSVLVDCCELGKNRMTDFHKAANKCRALYKTSKFESMKDYLKTCKSDIKEIIEGCDKITIIQNKIKEERDKFYVKTYNELSGKCNELIEAHKPLIEQIYPHSKPKTEEYYLLKVETNKNNANENLSEIENSVKEHNDYIKEIFERLENFNDDIVDAFSEKSASQVFKDKLKYAASEDIVNTLGAAAIGAYFLGIGGLIVLAFGGLYSAFASPIKTIIAASQGMESAVADLGSTRETLINIQGLIKDLEREVKNVTKKQADIKHTADFLLKDQKRLAKLGQALTVCSSDMEDGLDDEKESVDDDDSPIRACRRKVAVLISELGEKLQLAGQPS